uniref:Uncharacterized protein n=1 Tax=Solanum tuberosum TaxID=4113 RepID=M1DDZ7_SOLTU
MGDNLLCHPCSEFEHYPSLLVGNGTIGPCPLFHKSSEQPRGCNSSPKPDFPCAGNLGGDEAGYGDLQQPVMAIDGHATTYELYTAITPLLPLPHLGESPVQPTGTDDDEPRKLSFPNFFFPSTGSRGSIQSMDCSSKCSEKCSRNHGGELEHNSSQQLSVNLPEIMETDKNCSSSPPRSQERCFLQKITILGFSPDLTCDCPTTTGPNTPQRPHPGGTNPALEACTETESRNLNSKLPFRNTIQTLTSKTTPSR